jgi:ABC-type branched-subunit amino acid transport system substrate-binding protein
MRASRTIRCLAFVAAGALVASCGDDGGGTDAQSSEPSSSESAGSPAVPGQSYKVMISGDFTSPVFAVPESLVAATSVLEKIPGLEIVQCNTKGDPTAALECERKAVDEKVVAVLSGLGVLAASHEVLTQAGIPVVGYAVETQPNAFSVTSGIGNYAALGVGVAKAGCKRMATIFLDAGAEQLPDIIKAGAELNGATEVARAGAPANAPDLAAPVAILMDADPDCIVVSLPPTMVVQAVTAIDQAGADDDLLLSGVNAIFGPETLETLGPLADGVLIPAVQVDPADDAPVVDEVKEAMADVDESVEVTSTAISTWATSKILETALASIDGEITPASVLAAMNALRDVDVHGAIHNYSSIELTNPIVKRSFNHYAINYKIEDGKFVRQGDFYDLAPVLEDLKF